MTNSMIALNRCDSPFESIKHIDQTGSEIWYARDLMPLLGYQRWERVPDVIDRAIIACQNAGNPITQHFLEETRKSNGRPKQDFVLSRYACYLVAMNGDPRKPEIASAQSYFAVKTREAELRSQPTPKTAIELARENIELAKQQLQILEHLEIVEAQKRLLEQQNEQLSEAVDELFSYSSVIRIAKFNNVSEANFKWHLLKATSQQMNLEIKRVPCPRFGYKLLYHHDVWRKAYPEFMLPETTTLVINR